MTASMQPNSKSVIHAQHRAMAFSLGFVLLLLYVLFLHYDMPKVLLGIGGAILLPWFIMVLRKHSQLRHRPVPPAS